MDRDRRLGLPRTDHAPLSLTPRWVPVLFAALSIALLPGITRLFTTAAPPHLAWHWRLAWSGFDLALAGLLTATGLALHRRSALAQVLAAMTAALLGCDAWTDALSSGGHSANPAVVAIAEAALVELPLAVLFGWVAIRSARQATHPGPHPPAPPELRPLPRWLPAVSVGLGAALVPWIAWLLATLPRRTVPQNWHISNAGLDLALALILAASSIALLRRWPVAPALTAMAAALLLRDAWFNVLTARPGHATLALAVAAVLELPLAALCLSVAIWHARLAAARQRRPRPERDQAPARLHGSARRPPLPASWRSRA